MKRIKKVSYQSSYFPSSFHQGGQQPQRVSAEFIKKLEEAINGEATAIRFYGDLLNLVRGDRTAYDNVKHAYDDENKHFRAFVDLYVSLTGRQPSVRITPMRYTSLADAYRQAFFGELEAAELYSDMYLMTRDPDIRDIFFMAKNDEQEHAQRFQFLYNRELRRMG